MTTLDAIYDGVVNFFFFTFCQVTMDAYTSDNFSYCVIRKQLACNIKQPLVLHRNK